MEQLKFTPAMKKLLQQMKDEGLYITKSIADSKYYLRSEDTFLRTVKWDWMVTDGLEYFFTRSYENSRYTYRLRDDAELTAEWLNNERARVAQVAKQKSEDEEREKQRQNERATELFGCTEGRYTVKMYGQWPFKGEIWCGEEFLMDFSAATYSTGDMVDDVFAKEENKAHFERIQHMIWAANRA